MKPPADIRIQGGRPADAPADPPAQGLLNLGQHQFGGDSMFEGKAEGNRLFRKLQLPHCVAHGKSPVEDFQGRPSLGFGHARDLGVNLLVDPRHAGKPVRPGGLDVLCDMVDTAAEGDGTAGQQRGVDTGACKHVGQRQKEKHLVVRVPDHGSGHRLGRERDVVVGEHAPLGNPGCPRRVDDAGNVTGRDRRRHLIDFFIGNALAERHEFLEADDPVIRGRIAGEQDHFAHVRDLLPDLNELVELGPVFCKGNHRIAVVDDIGDIRSREAVVDADGLCADDGNGHVAQHPPVAGVAQNRDLVALFNPQGDQGPGRLPHLPVKPAPGDCLGLTRGGEPPVGRLVLAALDGLFQKVVNVRVVLEFVHPLSSCRSVRWVSGRITTYRLLVQLKPLK